MDFALTRSPRCGEPLQPAVMADGTQGHAGSCERHSVKRGAIPGGWGELWHPTTPLREPYAVNLTPVGKRLSGYRDEI